MLHGILNNSLSQDRFGEVDVTVIPEANAVDRIFRIPELSRLEIIVLRPNPDDLGEYEKEVFEKIDKQNARRYETALVKKRGRGSLKPDEDTRALADIAASNGYVKGHGRDAEGLLTDESTRDHPERRVIRLVDRI
jgi:hypothetical protein